MIQTLISSTSDAPWQHALDALATIAYLLIETPQGYDATAIKALFNQRNLKHCGEGAGEELQRLKLELLATDDILSIIFTCKYRFIEQLAQSHLQTHPLRPNIKNHFFADINQGMETHDIQSLINAIADDYGLPKAQNIYTIDDLDHYVMNQFSHIENIEIVTDYVQSWKNMVDRAFSENISEFFNFVSSDLQGILVGPDSQISTITEKDLQSLNPKTNKNILYCLPLSDQQQLTLLFKSSQSKINPTSWDFETTIDLTKDCQITAKADETLIHNELFLTRLVDHLIMNNPADCPFIVSADTWNDFKEKSASLFRLSLHTIESISSFLSRVKNQPWTGINRRPNTQAFMTLAVQSSLEKYISDTSTTQVLEELIAFDNQASAPSTPEDIDRLWNLTTQYQLTSWLIQKLSDWDILESFANQLCKTTTPSKPMILEFILTILKSQPSLLTKESLHIFAGNFLSTLSEPSSRAIECFLLCLKTNPTLIDDITLSQKQIDHWLTIMVFSNNPLGISYCLHLGANPNQKIEQSSGQTTLLIATINQNLKAACSALLTSKTIDCNQEDHSGKTPIQIATLSGKIDILEILTQDMRVDVNVKNNTLGKRNVLFFATKNHRKLVEYLLKRPDLDLTIKLGGKPAVFFSLQYQTYDLFIENSRIDLNQTTGDYDDSLLTYAVICKNAHAVESLVKKGLDPTYTNKNGLNAYMLSLASNQTDCINIFKNDRRIKHLKNLSTQEKGYLFLAAIEYNNRQLIDELLAKPEELDLKVMNADGDTALHIAAKKNNLNTFKWLLDQNLFNINQTNIHGETILITAALSNHTAVVSTVKILLQNKDININYSSKGEYAAIQCAIANNNTILINCLIDDKRTKLDLKDEYGNNPLMDALNDISFDEETLKRLITDPRSDLTATNKKGEDALMIAIRSKKRWSIIQSLIEHHSIDLDYPSNPAFNILAFAHNKGIEHHVFMSICTQKNISIQTVYDFLTSDIDPDLQQTIRNNLGPDQDQALRKLESRNTEAPSS